MSALPAVSDLLPHGPEALCLDKVVLYVPGERAAARLRVRPELLLYDESLGGIPAWAGVEIMAQALGVYVGMDARDEGLGPRVGYLIGVRHFHAARPLIENGLELLVEAECRYSEPYGLGRFDCRILADDEELARANLTVWRPPPQEAAA
ncbi:MAG: 3-hydroxylacyl-ACP dehydratase [Gammaproteobacteria bacterium]